MEETTRELLLRQLALYPGLELQDALKALYQAEFGCEHFVSDEETGLKRLRAELDGLPATAAGALVEPLDGRFCRVHLGRMREAGLRPETLFRLFALTSRAPAGGMERFARRLDCLQMMCDGGELPFETQKARSTLADYRADGCPAVHHSERFRALYGPAYRLVRADFCALLPVFARIDRILSAKPRAIVAIDGGSASGKSTLAALFAAVYGANVLHMDDFFLRPEQRTASRFAEPGGNVDYERFYAEVLTPLCRETPFAYRPWDCQTQTLLAPVAVAPKALSVVEGAYSLHESFGEPYDLRLFVDVDPETQAARILKRNGAEMRKRFLEEWIPLENRYFAAMDVAERCDMVLRGEELPAPLD